MAGSPRPLCSSHAHPSSVGTGVVVVVVLGVLWLNTATRLGTDVELIQNMNRTFGFVIKTRLSATAVLRPVASVFRRHRRGLRSGLRRGSSGLGRRRGRGAVQHVGVLQPGAAVGRELRADPDRAAGFRASFAGDLAP